MSKTQPEHSDSLPPGFQWEYREGMDGGGSYSQTHSESWPCTVYKRAVGPWIVERPGGPAHKITTRVVTGG